MCKERVTLIAADIEIQVIELAGVVSQLCGDIVNTEPSSFRREIE
jgi:hypothetical protein